MSDAGQQITKACTACSRTMPLDRFKPQRKGKHGRTARCRECVNRAARRAYADRSAMIRYGYKTGARSCRAHAIYEITCADTSADVLRAVSRLMRSSRDGLVADAVDAALGRIAEGALLICG